jgi:DDE superfamily endonuclease
LQKCWVIPPEHHADFVATMEDVLDLYQCPYDPRSPVVNMDEKPIQRVKETRTPLPAKPGKPQRYDYEYERGGTANVFLFTEPLRGWRTVDVREQRTGVDWAHQIKRLVDEHYPTAEKVRVVCDNLNTHKVASLYEAFEPAEAHRLARRLELHYTPKHGSWLNIAEIELSVLTKQCLDQRIADLETLQQETKAWEHERNAKQTGVDWQFTTDDARIRLKRLYPQYQG